MDISQAVRASGAIPKEDVPAFLAALELPYSEWLLSEPHRELKSLQGDFLRDIPTPYIKPDLSPFVPKRTVMVVNNSCDLPEGRTEFVTVAPALDFAGYLAAIKNRSSVANRAKDLVQNRITELLYVPRLQGFSEGAIVRLDALCSVPKTVYRDAIDKGNRIASFTQSGFYFLLIKLTHHFARIESHEVTRTGTNKEQRSL